jgi:transcriptional regulator GlxA family with amidase domain
VRRAEDFIEAHARAGFSVCDLAGAVGVSLRTLQTGFRQFRQKTPSEALLDARLDLWRRTLTDPNQKDSIADLAAAVGLPHAGRAAAAYRRRYGESPSATRRLGLTVRR